MTRRANGEGSIFRLPNGKWRVQVEFPSLPGRPRRRVVRHMPTKMEAVAMLQRLREDAGAASPERMTVATLLAGWIERGDWAPSTKAQRLIAANKHIVPHLGRVLVADLKPVHVVTWVSGLTCGPRMKQLAFDVLKMGCDYAADLELIGRNPCAKIPRPKCRRKAIRPFTPCEAEQIIDATRDTAWHAFVVLCLSCGTRQGELFGLRWESVDLKAGTITINTQATDVGGKVYVRPTKTAAGVRTIPLTKAASEALIGQRAIQMRSDLAGCDLVFPAPEGGYMDRGRFRTRIWGPLLTSLNIDHRGAHHQRHTFATLALGAGIPAHVVSSMLGHSKVSTTLDLYAHAIPAQQQEAVAILQRLFG